MLKQKLKLLVVDDDEGIIQIISDVAKIAEFEVISTTNSSEVGLLYSDEIDVIVIDIFMPKLDGIEVLRFLSEKHSKASIVLISGKDKSILHSAQALAKELKLNPIAILSKPFHIDELEALLMKCNKRDVEKRRTSDELPTLDEIRVAIDQKQIFPVFQPQVNISNRSLVGVEALARWKHPVKGMIFPGQFIPIAEENGLISEITDLITEQAVRQLGLWTRDEFDIRVSINISPLLLSDLEIPEKLSTHAEQMGAKISDIVIEVTETALMSDLSKYMDILARMRIKGFGLSIDDFGTGYSSLQQLVRVPFNELKIDQAFIRDLDTNAECLTITKASISLAHELGMSVVAEGIETESVWNVLAELGCDEGQGYWMGKPMLAEEITRWATLWNAT